MEYRFIQVIMKFVASLKRKRVVRDRNSLVLLLILSLAFWLRFYRLEEIPSFHEDEADLAYNAYSILQTGKDQMSQFLPIATTSLGDARPAFYVYLAVPAIKFFGLTVFAARLPALVFSTLTVIIMYYLANLLFRNKFISLSSSFLMAVSFWHITLSREASEKMTSLFFLITGIYFLLRFIKQEAKYYTLFVAFLFLFLAIHTYYAPRMFLLLFLPVLVLAYWSRLNVKKKYLLLLFTALFLITASYVTFFHKFSAERINQLLIFNNPKTIALLQEQISEEGHTANVYLTRFFHNKPINYSFTFLENFLEHFSPNFLFMTGDSASPRYDVPAVGLLNLFEAPLLLLGIYFLFFAIHINSKRELFVLPVWILFAVLPSGFTFHQVPSSYRISPALPPLILLTSFGLWHGLSLFKTLMRNRRFIVFPIALIFLGGYVWHVLFFVHQYFKHFEIHKPWYRHYAQKELASFLREHMHEYRKIYITDTYGSVDHLLKFYLEYDPRVFQRESRKKFANFVFVDEICPYPRVIHSGQAGPSPDYLFVNRAECGDEDKISQEIKVITWKDGVPAYRLVILRP